ncbi:MAG: MFS transporter, partial [Candidatus Ranarchaeia archaeon]
MPGYSSTRLPAQGKSNTIKRNLPLLSIYGLLSALGLGVTNPVLQPYAAAFLPNISLFGTLLTVANGLALTFILIGGFLADSYGRRISVIFGTLLSFLGMASIFLAVNWTWILIGLVFSQAGQVTIIAGNSAATAESAHKGQTGVAFGLTTTLRQLGVMFGPLIGGYVWELTGNQRLPFLISIGLYLSCLPTIIRIQETHKGSSQQPMISFKAIKEGFQRLPDSRSLKYLILVQVILGFGLGMSRQLRIIYLYNVINASRLEVSWMLSVSGLVSIILLVPVGKLSDHVGRVPVVVSYEILQIGMTIFQAFLVETSQLIAIGMLDGLCMAMIVPSFRPLQSELMPGEHRARLWAFYQFIGAAAVFPAALA